MRPSGDLPNAGGDAVAQRRLVRIWARWVAAGMAALALTAAGLRSSFSEPIGPWIIVNLAALAGILALVRNALPDNRRDRGSPLLANLGAGNHLTVLRGVLIAQLPGYLLFPQPGGWAAWMPAVTYGAAQAADYLDGYLARRADHATRLGERLDIEFDGLGLLAATALAVHYGQFPLIYLLTVGIARYLYLGVGWIARRAGRTTAEIPPSVVRRGLAGAVMELGVAALWPIVPPAMMNLAGVIIGVPVLAGFVRDTLIHIGLLDPEWPTYARTRQKITGFVSVILPVFLRLALVLSLGPLLAARWVGGGGPAPGVVLASVFLAMIVFGFAGRSAAVGLILVIGLDLALGELSFGGLAAWGLSVAIYLAGTGAGSLWQPEAVLVRLRAGERR